MAEAENVTVRLTVDAAELQKVFSPAVIDVLTERERQQSVEGFTPDHDDDTATDGELSKAAASYAEHASFPDHVRRDWPRAPKGWPWRPEWWKPTSRRRDLVKAAALILAEIERIDRAAERTSEQVTDAGA